MSSEGLSTDGIGVRVSGRAPKINFRQSSFLVGTKECLAHGKLSNSMKDAAAMKSLGPFVFPHAPRPGA